MHSLAGREVLDLGCGVGGAAILMADRLGAKRVLGVDVEAASLARAAASIEAADLAERIALQHIEPGPLPFPDDSFDLAFTNDVLCHLPDKWALFAEVLRVLRPGGVFAGGDWMAGPNAAGSATFEDWVGQLRDAGLHFTFEPLAVYRQGLAASGFDLVEATDGSVWAEKIAREQHEAALGSARAEALSSIGQEAYDRRLRLTRTRLEAIACGAIQHCHFRARKPAGSSAK